MDRLQNALYEFKLGNKAAPAARNINLAFGQLTRTNRNAVRWFTKFCLGVTDLEDEEGRVRPVSVDNDRLKALVEQNPRTTE